MRVLAAIERLLAADGLLFIGHADRLDISGAEPKFIAVGDPACFVYRREARVIPSSPRPLRQLDPALVDVGVESRRVSRLLTLLPFPRLVPPRSPQQTDQPAEAVNLFVSSQ